LLREELHEIRLVEESQREENEAQLPRQATRLRFPLLLGQSMLELGLREETGPNSKFA
jgi:hypothetical protein